MDGELVGAKRQDKAGEKRKAAEALDGGSQRLYALAAIDRRRNARGLRLLTFSIDKPQEDPNIRGDPFRTLFVSRLSYDVEPKDLEREFGRFGPIERV